jgi:hypothetical protein
MTVAGARWGSPDPDGPEELLVLVDDGGGG